MIQYLSSHHLFQSLDALVSHNRNSVWFMKVIRLARMPSTICDVQVYSSLHVFPLCSINKPRTREPSADMIQRTTPLPNPSMILHVYTRLRISGAPCIAFPSSVLCLSTLPPLNLLCEFLQVPLFLYLKAMIRSSFYNRPT